MLELLGVHGLVVHDVDAVVAWAGPNDPGPPYLQAAPADLVFEAAVALGASQVNSVIVGERGVTHDELATTIDRCL